MQASEFVDQLSRLEILPIEEYKTLMKRQRKLKAVEALLKRIISKDLYSQNGPLLEFLLRVSKDPLYLLKNVEEAKSVIDYIIKSNKDLEEFFEALNELEVEDYYRLWIDHYKKMLDHLSRLKGSFREYVRAREGYNSAILSYYNLFILYVEKIIEVLEARVKLPSDRIKVRARDLGSSRLFAASSMLILYFLYPILAYVEEMDYYEDAVERSVLMLDVVEIPPSDVDEVFMKIIVPEGISP